MTPLALSGLLITATCFSLAGALVTRAARSLPTQLMVAFNVAVGIWGVGTLFAGLAQTAHTALWAWRIAHVGGFFLGMIFFHLASVLARTKERIAIVFNYCFAGIAAILSVLGIAMPDTEWRFSSLYYYKANVVYAILVATWVAIVLLGHWRLYCGYRLARGLERSQLRFILIALATGFLGGITTLLPSFGANLYPYGNFSISIYSFVATYGIVKYGLGDTRLVITQAGLLLGTYFVVLGFPFVVGWRGASSLSASLGPQWWLVPLGLSTALATLGPFAYAQLRRRAEERLLSEQRRYQRTLQRASRGMTQVRNVRRLSNLITRIVSGSVRMTHASLFLWDKVQQRYLLEASHGHKRLAVQSRYGLENHHPLIQWLTEERRVLPVGELDPQQHPAISQELASLNATLVIPGLIERRLIGFLVLGSKLSGAGYSQDDLHAFTTLANEAAIAIENAISYEELVKLNEQLKAASERLLRQERLAAAGQFATGMMHEIKNPLSAIKTFAEYLPERYADPAFREKFFRIVQSEIDRINSIVKELSDFAKPAPLSMRPVQLAQLIEDTITLLSDQCLKQNIELQCRSQVNGLAIQADPQQMKQVLLNLVLNSMEAMNAKGGTITIEVAAYTAPL